MFGNSEFGEDEWKVIASAALFSGMAYIFFDVGMSGVINFYSVAAYLLTFILILIIGEYRLS